MDPLDSLIKNILKTAPHQLPPIVLSGGCYQLSLTYLGRKHESVSISLEESLRRYWEFVTKANYEQVRKNPSCLSEIPVPLGTTIYPNRQ